MKSWRFILSKFAAVVMRVGRVMDVTNPAAILHLLNSFHWLAAIHMPKKTKIREMENQEIFKSNRTEKAIRPAMAMMTPIPMMVV
jgi:hypothetical protein